MTVVLNTVSTRDTAFNSAKLPSSPQKTRYNDRIVRETIEIELHPYNINRAGGF
jgi:hypothetical protein